VAAHEDDQASAEVVGEQWHGDGGDDSPDDEGVPLPLPDLVEQAEGMMAEVFQLVAVEGEAAGVEQVDAEFDKRNEEQQVQGSYDVEAELGGDLAEAEGPGDQDDEEGGETHGRIDTDDEAEGEAPSETTRGDAAAQEAEEGAQDFAPEFFTKGVGQVHFWLDADWRDAGGQSWRWSGLPSACGSARHG
jgi:hypothetical protein